MAVTSYDRGFVDGLKTGKQEGAALVLRELLQKTFRHSVG
jgi:hypothetical protein